MAFRRVRSAPPAVMESAAAISDIPESSNLKSCRQRRMERHLHQARQPGCENRECDQDGKPDQIRNDEGDNTIENGRDVYVLHDALDDEDIHSDRWMDQSEFDRHDN